MRVALLIVSAAVALLAVSTGFAATERESARPTVRVAQLSPVVVAGERFRPVERIVIRLATSTRTHTRTLRTTRRGTFVARFETASAHRCNGGVSVVVTTASGLVAKARTPEALCPLPNAPGMP
jgi:hypothetical protein